MAGKRPVFTKHCFTNLPDNEVFLKWSNSTTWPMTVFVPVVRLTVIGSAHIAKGMVRIPIPRNSLHQLIAEEDDDAVPLVFHHHRSRR